MKDRKEEKIEKTLSEERECAPYGEGVEESNSARVLRVRGGGAEAPGTAAEGVKVSWFENFWYHHKWKVIIISAFALIAAIATWQLLSRSEPDVYVMYAGPAYVNASRQEDVKAAFAVVMEDYDGDGEKNIQFATVTYNENGTNPSTAMTQFTTELSAGDSGVYILSSHMYEVAKGTEVLVSLEEIFGSLPESALDRYAIKLSETDFYKELLMLAVEEGDPVPLLPEDSVICLRAPTFLNSLRDSDEAKEQYAFHESLFKAIVTYSGD